MFVMLFMFAMYRHIISSQPGFNAPLAGILFAMEELQHVSSRLTTRVICIILIGSIISTGATGQKVGWKNDGLFLTDETGGKNMEQTR